MTDQLFKTDSYLKSFSATVIDVDGSKRAIVLNRSAFYPGGGGQPCDTGSMVYASHKFDVCKVKKEAATIYHYIGGDQPLPETGNLLECKIDWHRRYALMRTHTAMHILCGVIFRDYGASVTGGDMELLKGRMDFEFETMQRELVIKIEEAVNIEVEKARPIFISILPREDAFKIPDLIRTKINLLPEGIQEVRVVEIQGLDIQADGGTHVTNTSEVGPIKVIDYKSKGKINKRIYIEIGEIGL